MWASLSQRYLLLLLLGVVAIVAAVAAAVRLRVRSCVLAAGSQRAAGASATNALIDDSGDGGGSEAHFAG